jgi:hypothetical protein
MYKTSQTTGKYSQTNQIIDQDESDIDENAIPIEEL